MWGVKSIKRPKKIKTNHKPLFFIIFLILVLLITINTPAAQDSPRILFDESGPYGGNGYTIYNIGLVGTSAFANLLEKNGFMVSKLVNEPITAEMLKRYDVLILMGPGSNYTDSEIDAIHQFVNNGGGAISSGK